MGDCFMTLKGIPHGEPGSYATIISFSPALITACLYSTVALLSSSSKEPGSHLHTISAHFHKSDDVVIGTNTSCDNDRKTSVFVSHIFYRRQQVVKPVFIAVNLVHLKAEMPSCKRPLQNNGIRPVTVLLPFFADDVKGSCR